MQKKKKPEPKHVCGLVIPATTDGFEALLKDANARADQHYELVQVLPLEGGRLYGALYRRTRAAASGSLF